MNISTLLQKLSIIALVNVFAKVLWFLLFIYAARVLGPTDFGVFTLFQAFCLNVIIFIDFGLDYYYIKTVSGDNDKAIKELEKIEIIRFLIFVLILIISISVFLFIGKEAHEIVLFVLILIYLVINVFNITYKNYFSSILDFSNYSKWTTIEKIVLSLSGFSILYFSSSLSIFVLTLTIFSLLIMLAMRLTIFKNATYKSSRKIDWSIFKKTYPYMIMNLFVIGYFRIDVIILNYLNIETFQLGIYGAQHRLIETYMLLPSVLTTVLFPYISVHQKNKQELVLNSQIVQSFLFVISIIFCSVVMVYSDFISYVLWGREYQNGIENLGYLILSAIPLGFNFLLGYYIIAAGKEKKNILILIYAFLLNMILNIYLIPDMGIKGATFTLIITELFIVLYYGIYYDKYYADHFVKNIYIDLLIVVISMCILWYFHREMVIPKDVFLAIIIILNLYFILKTIIRNIKIFRNVFK